MTDDVEDRLDALEGALGERYRPDIMLFDRSACGEGLEWVNPPPGIDPTDPEDVAKLDLEKVLRVSLTATHEYVIDPETYRVTDARPLFDFPEPERAPDQDADDQDTDARGGST